MVVAGGTKGAVQVHVLGINDVNNMLKRKGMQITAGAGVGILKAATYVSEEVQESIMGNRSEPRSVDTGNFGNSISVAPSGKLAVKIFPKGIGYAKYLEHGTSRIGARGHFGNTKNRTRDKVVGILRGEIKKIR